LMMADSDGDEHGDDCKMELLVKYGWIVVDDYDNDDIFFL